MTNLTASELAARFNELTGRNVKPTSYSKAKFIEMIEAHTEAAPAATPDHDTDHNSFPNQGICPHCGIDYLDNGYQTHDTLTSDGLPGLTTHDHICLACDKEFGNKLNLIPETDTFTMSEAAKAAGVSPKAARARYRSVDNDHTRTQYVFPKKLWNEVILIISPKRKGR